MTMLHQNALLGADDADHNRVGDETVVTETVEVAPEAKPVAEFDVNIDENSFNDDQVHASSLKVIEDILSTPEGQQAIPIILRAAGLGTDIVQQALQVGDKTEQSQAVSAELPPSIPVILSVQPSATVSSTASSVVEAAPTHSLVQAIPVGTPVVTSAPANSSDTKKADNKPAPTPSKPADAAVLPDDERTAKDTKKTDKKDFGELSLVSEKKHTITLNASMPLTGSMALVGRDYLTGINLIFDKFNRAGGLDKKYLIKYVTSDDRYVSTVAKDNIQKSTKESPLFVGNFGSHALATAENLIESGDVVMFFPTVGDTSFRKKDFRNVINLRPSMETELRALLNFSINDRHRKKIAVFYEENQWGKTGLAIVEKILQEFNLSPCARGSYPANTIAVVPASAEIIKSRPDAIVCISTYRPTYNFIQLVLNEGFQHCLFLGLGPSTPMQQLLKKSRGVTIATTSVVPDPARSKLPIVEAYRKDMAKYFPLREMSQYSLEGYLVGSVFVSALKQLEAPYTVDKMLKFFEGLSRKDYGGFKINFNPDTRELSSKVWVNKGIDDAEWDASFC